MVKLSKIFFVFLKLGALTFGGGLAMIPIIKRDIVDRNWISDEELSDYIAVAQVAPGMIAINIAVLVGMHLRGRKGSFLAVLGVALPSLIIITIIASILKEFSDIPLIVSALKGIIIVVVILLISAIYEIGKKSIKNIYLLFYALMSFSLVYFLNVSTALVILLSFAIGTLHALVVSRKRVQHD
ncbi:MAG: chromate transporter [Acholeplasmataceae bacterium]|nr:chromate transporter [Acholeplasmataceae bacterium]